MAKTLGAMRNNRTVLGGFKPEEKKKVCTERQGGQGVRGAMDAEIGEGGAKKGRRRDEKGNSGS